MELSQYMEAHTLTNLAEKQRSFFVKNPGACLYYESPGTGEAGHRVSLVFDGKKISCSGVSYEEAVGNALTLALFLS